MRKAIGYVWGTAFVLLAWWLLSACVASPALPSPVQTVQELVAMSDSLIPQSGISLARLLLGLAIGPLIGAPLGLLSGMCPKVDRSVAPALFIRIPIPKIVFLPVLFVFFGVGGQSKVILIVIAVLFQAMVTMRDAAHAVPVGRVEAMRSLGGSGAHVFMHVMVPATLPFLFNALRVSTGTAVAILFIGESMAGSTGLGYYIMNSWSMLEYARMFSGIVALSVIGVALYELFDLCERRLS